jgi:hypothetical protein
MIRRGFLRKDAAVTVHRYVDRKVIVRHGHGTPPYEIHFLPGMKQILVLGTAKY